MPGYNSVSFVIPVFRSSESALNELVERIVTVGNSLGVQFEIIFIEDDGGGKSWQALVRLTEKYPQICIIRLARNFGQHNALMCGFAHAKGDVIITLDDDLQNPPEEVVKLLEKIDEGFYVVYGLPRHKMHHVGRRFGSAAIQVIFQKTFKVDYLISAFRAIRREVITSILVYQKNFTFIDGLLAWATSSVTGVSVEHSLRKEGRSGYSIAALLRLSLNLLTNFSIFPLQVSSCVGLILAVGSFCLGLYCFMRYFIVGIPVAGYTSLIIAVTFLSSIQLISLGFIGEYLGRVHLNINAKPQYVVREIKQKRSNTFL